MAINLARAQPAKFARVVQDVKKANQLAQSVTGTKQLLHHLEKMAPLPPVSYDMRAAQACKQNNERVCTMAEVEEGGNMALYHQITGETHVCEDYTMKQWTSTDGLQFVALQMIMNWGRMGPHQHKTPVLEPFVTAVGINMMSHKAYTNVTQCLYVKGAAVTVVPQRPVTRPVEVYQPPMVPVVATTIIEQPRNMGGVMMQGHLKLHLQQCILEHHQGP